MVQDLEFSDIVNALIMLHSALLLRYFRQLRCPGESGRQNEQPNGVCQKYVTLSVSRRKFSKEYKV